MKINPNDPLYKNITTISILTTDSVQKLQQLARQQLQDYYELTINDIDTLITKNYIQKKRHFRLPDRISLLQHFWYTGFIDFLQNELATTLANLKTPASLIKSYEKQAQKHLLKTTFIENLLIFTRNYFALPSFTQASQTPLAEVILALKDKTNTDIFQRLVADLQIKQMKRKK